ncbi:centromere protein L-like [Dysidea avara]|uniref:centromere protein L-like n=1 Tax=Dysidea avara TaxID=196820 RepID=UPI00332433B7
MASSSEASSSRTRSGRRMTPYSTSRRKARTPRIEEANVLPVISEDSGASAEPSLSTSQLSTISSELLYKTWRLHWVNQLYKFNYSHLKQYSKKLTTHIRASNILMMDDGSSVDLLKSRISICNELSLEGLPRAVKVVVFTIKQRKEVPILVAYLCCLAKDIQTVAGFTSLPLLLIKSTSALSKKFLGWLSLSFDCYTWRLQFLNKEMRHIMAHYLAENKDHKVMAVYNSPEDIKDAGLSEVTLELSAIDTTTIMESLQQRFSSDQIGSEFLKLMEEDFKTSTHIKLEQFTMSKFMTATVCLDMTGRIKLGQADKVLHILTTITSIYEYK